jgi:hypothetical protein
LHRDLPAGPGAEEPRKIAGILKAAQHSAGRELAHNFELVVIQNLAVSMSPRHHKRDVTGNASRTDGPNAGVADHHVRGSHERAELNAGHVRAILEIAGLTMAGARLANASYRQTSLLDGIVERLHQAVERLEARADGSEQNHGNTRGSSWPRGK